ncbi:response regulator [Novispirillum sp. DQ9]|uniref:response regulator n=1 Tax=Novispirillum sp. DQ9 TaxID=3398612 RepID=UPI003C7C9E5F
MFQEDAARIVVADDHPLFRDALRQVIDVAVGPARVVEAETFGDAVAAVAAEDPDLVLLDLNMPGMDGFAGLMALRDKAPTTPIVVVSADEDPAVIQQALTLGASGFIPKSMSKDRMTQGVAAVMAGEVFVPVDLTTRLTPAAQDDPDFAAGYAALTAQQRKVLEMLVAGKSNKVIAFELDVAESTVKAHVSAILRKLKVTSRTQAVLYASKMPGVKRAAA